MSNLSRLRCATDDQATEAMLWRATAHPAPPCSELVGTHEADVAIIGAGFTGLSAALHLAEAGKHVAVLDAHQPGWGASGRNGGQINPGFKVLPSQLLTSYGQTRGRYLIGLAQTACDDTLSLIDRLAIECEARRPGYVQGSIGARGLVARDAWVNDWRREGAEVEPLTRRAISDLLGTKRYCGGYLDHRGGSLQPLSYARGLAAAAQSEGAHLFGDTPVLEIKQAAGSDWQLTTPKGYVTASNVVIATNAYGGAIWPGLKESVVPVRTFIAATDPLPGPLRDKVLPGGHAVSETRRVQVYYRMDAEGRFIIGGRGNRTNCKPNGSVDHLHQEACVLFPALNGIDWPYAWNGLVAMNLTHIPSLVRLDRGVYSALGYNGRGVAMATVMGRELASLVKTPEGQSASPLEIPAPIPFHRFRQAGVTYRLTIGAVLDRLDQARQ